jgi:hypothetical protein
VLLALVLFVLVLLQALALGLDLALGALPGQSGELTRGANNTPARRRGTKHIPYSHSLIPPSLSPLHSHFPYLIPIPCPCQCSLSMFPVTVTAACPAVVPSTVAVTVIKL